jgi:hypothetical protein
MATKANPSKPILKTNSTLRPLTAGKSLLLDKSLSSKSRPFYKFSDPKYNKSLNSLRNFSKNENENNETTPLTWSVLTQEQIDEWLTAELDELVKYFIFSVKKIIFNLKKFRKIASYFTIEQWKESLKPHLYLSFLLNTFLYVFFRIKIHDKFIKKNITYL